MEGPSFTVSLDLMGVMWWDFCRLYVSSVHWYLTASVLQYTCYILSILQIMEDKISFRQLIIERLKSESMYDLLQSQNLDHKYLTCFSLFFFLISGVLHHRHYCRNTIMSLSVMWHIGDLNLAIVLALTSYEILTMSLNHHEFLYIISENNYCPLNRLDFCEVKWNNMWKNTSEV